MERRAAAGERTGPTRSPRRAKAMLRRMRVKVALLERVEPETGKGAAFWAERSRGFVVEGDWPLQAISEQRRADLGSSLAVI